jgi:hypothetical protein
MIRNQRHSHNAVAKRARRRMERAAREWDEGNRSAPVPRRPAADFILTIRSRSGDRVQVSATRVGKQLLTADGLVSARQLARGIEHLLRLATP